LVMGQSVILDNRGFCDDNCAALSLLYGRAILRVLDEKEEVALRERLPPLSRSVVVVFVVSLVFKAFGGDGE